MNQQFVSGSLNIPGPPPRKSLAERVADLERKLEHLETQLAEHEDLFWRHSHASDGSGVLGNNR